MFHGVLLVFLFLPTDFLTQERRLFHIQFIYSHFALIPLPVTRYPIWLRPQAALGLNVSLGSAGVEHGFQLYRFVIGNKYHVEYDV
jgi:hypothetical protein